MMQTPLEKVTFVSALAVSHRSLNNTNLNSHTLTPQNLPEKKDHAALKKKKSQLSVINERRNSFPR